jgi:hypothetical protein
MGEPDYSKEPTFIMLTTHSPVELHVYDSKGRHTGIIPMPPEYKSKDIEEGLYTFYDKNIPGSSIENVGSDEDPEYEVTLRDNKNENYLVVLTGTGVGEFTFDVKRYRGSEILDSVKYVDLPVTPLTVATTSIRARTDENASTKLYASTTPILHIDVNGDGSSDILASSSSKFDPIIYLEAIKKTVSTLAGNLPRGKALIKRIDALESLIKKGKLNKVHKVASNLDKRVKHIKSKKLTDVDRNQILDMIDMFIAQFE